MKPRVGRLRCGKRLCCEKYIRSFVIVLDLNNRWLGLRSHHVKNALELCSEAAVCLQGLSTRDRAVLKSLLQRPFILVRIQNVTRPLSHLCSLPILCSGKCRIHARVKSHAGRSVATVCLMIFCVLTRLFHQRRIQMRNRSTVHAGTGDVERLRD